MFLKMVVINEKGGYYWPLCVGVFIDVKSINGKGFLEVICVYMWFYSMVKHEGWLVVSRFGQVVMVSMYGFKLGASMDGHFMSKNGWNELHNGLWGVLHVSMSLHEVNMFSSWGVMVELGHSMPIPSPGACRMRCRYDISN